MSDFILPLELGTWLVSVLSGDIKVFTAISLIVITMMAAYFRMLNMTMMFMLGLFLIIFYNYIDSSLYFLFIAIAGLLVGVWVSKLVKS